VETITDVWADEWPRDMAALELALLRRGVEHRGAAHERCSCCGRTPLVGERVYLADDGPVVCELCRSGQGAPRLESRVVRGPNFGRGIRVIVGSAT
jgi:hypothetical protein